MTMPRYPIGGKYYDMDVIPFFWSAAWSEFAVFMICRVVLMHLEDPLNLANLETRTS